MSILENTPLCAVNVYVTVYSMWTEAEIIESEEGCCANCGARIAGNTDVVVDGKRWCSDCAYKNDIDPGDGVEVVTVAVPWESMMAMVYGRERV